MLSQEIHDLFDPATVGKFLEREKVFQSQETSLAPFFSDGVVDLLPRL